MKPTRHSIVVVAASLLFISGCATVGGDREAGPPPARSARPGSPAPASPGGLLR